MADFNNSGANLNRKLTGYSGVVSTTGTNIGETASKQALADSLAGKSGALRPDLQAATAPNLAAAPQGNATAVPSALLQNPVPAQPDAPPATVLQRDVPAHAPLSTQPQSQTAAPQPVVNPADAARAQAEQNYAASKALYQQNFVAQILKPVPTNIPNLPNKVASNVWGPAAQPATVAPAKVPLAQEQKSQSREQPNPFVAAKAVPAAQQQAAQQAQAQVAPRDKPLTEKFADNKKGTESSLAKVAQGAGYVPVGAVQTYSNDAGGQGSEHEDAHTAFAQKIETMAATIALPLAFGGSAEEHQVLFQVGATLALKYVETKNNPNVTVPVGERITNTSVAPFHNRFLTNDDKLHEQGVLGQWSSGPNGYGMSA